MFQSGFYHRYQSLLTHIKCPNIFTVLLSLLNPQNDYFPRPVEIQKVYLKAWSSHCPEHKQSTIRVGEVGGRGIKTRGGKGCCIRLVLVDMHETDASQKCEATRTAAYTQLLVDDWLIVCVASNKRSSRVF